MTEPRPTAAELVAAVAGFLTDQVVPALEGKVAFHTRVAANALRIVERELRLGAEAEAVEAERARLPGAPADDAALATLIREGHPDVDDPALRGYLIRSVRARIAIDSPDYPAVAQAAARWPDAGASGGPAGSDWPR